MRGYGETDFAERQERSLAEKPRREPSARLPADEARAPRREEVWLGRRDSNPNNRVQSAVSYR